MPSPTDFIPDESPAERASGRGDTRVVSLEATTVSVPYLHRETSSQVARDGVTEAVVRVETEGGLVGWGEACSGADAASIEAAIRAMAPFVVGRDAWNREAMRDDLFHCGLWQFRTGTGNFAWAGIEMALLDICGKHAGVPLYRLFGGLRRRRVSYFYYLARGTDAQLAEQCADGLARGYDCFYLKVGIEPGADLAMVAAARDALGPGPRLRIDVNGAWSVSEALRILDRMAEHDVEYVEQPVRDHPIGQLAEVRARAPMAVGANEGLWSEADTYARIVARQADVFCFSPYWVGGLDAFHRLSHVAHLEGLQVCKHTHGELGLAAAASQHLLLTLPNIVHGHQQTASMIEADVLRDPLPIAGGPTWGVPEGVGLCVAVDDGALADAARRYELEGQYLPYQPEQLGREDRDG